MKLMPRLTAAAALVSALAYGSEPPPAVKRPPSVLVILSDDQRADTIHALGNEAIRTPALDALVARGTVFAPDWKLIDYPRWFFNPGVPGLPPGAF
jgi:hypothetical protein